MAWITPLRDTGEVRDVIDMVLIIVMEEKHVCRRQNICLSSSPLPAVNCVKQGALTENICCV